MPTLRSPFWLGFLRGGCAKLGSLICAPLYDRWPWGFWKEIDRWRF